VVADLRWRLSVSKRAAQKLGIQKLDDLRKLNGAEITEQYQVRITNWFAALETWMITWTSLGKSKAVPLHAMMAPGGRGGIAPTHSQPLH
jgi:hypothetical protein